MKIKEGGGMDIQKEREVFEAWVGSNGRSIERFSDGSYKSMTLDKEWEAWQAAKAQAVPDLSELQERIAGHQYYHDEHGHMVVDMDDVVKEISSFDSCKAQAVPEGFVLISAEQMSQWGHMANCAEEYGCPECYEARGYAHSLACEINEFFAIEAQVPAND